MHAFFRRLLAGTFLAQDAENPQAGTFGGGLVKRHYQTTAVMNSTRINRRYALDGSGDLYEATFYGFAGRLPQDDKPVGFQYVEQDGYKGIVPWEILPQMPEQFPWE